MKRVALKFAYDGTRFAGYARQPNLLTVEGELTKALKRVKAIDTLESANFQSASRTDKGVSAIGNVCTFNTNFSLEVLPGAVNSKLKSVWIWAAREVADDFSPRKAILRTYNYFLPKNDLDVREMKQPASLFMGEHDFKNFCKRDQGKATKSKLDALQVEETASFIKFTFIAKSFLWRQVRKIVGALVEVGVGKVNKESIENALSKPNQRIDFETAPPEGLILSNVQYDFEFFINEKAKSKIILEVDEQIKKKEIDLLIHNSIKKGIR
ncbi:MAG TPA: tRNA pseudouridine(38-40) synthase TruA [Thermoplasmata archaeon]|nr:tRNA pseudouridine(38-40) synthase TruA [Thermoplasmata archaeon]